MLIFNLNNSIPPVGLSVGDVKVAHIIPLNYDLSHCFSEELLTFLFYCENGVIKSEKRKWLLPLLLRQPQRGTNDRLSILLL